MTVAILGGSFNPVHNGHIALARGVVQSGLAQEVWLTLSPLNPLKAHPEELLPDEVRLEMLRLATQGEPGLKVCDIELSLPRPSYTVNTLTALAERYPETDFRLLIGSDNMLIFDRWKDHEVILSRFVPIVYPRPGYPWPGALNLPVHDISSTEVRRMLKAGERVNNYIPAEVESYIHSHGLYKSS